MVTDSAEESAYSDDQFTEDSKGNMVISKKPRAQQQPVSYEDEDDDDDYEDDEDFNATGSMRKSGKDQALIKKLSLESDQEADENEFEEIGNEDYAEEDYDKDDSNENGEIG